MSQKQNIKNVQKEHKEKKEHKGKGNSNAKIDKWSRKHDCCIKCGTTERRHKGRGLCTSCNNKEYILYRISEQAENNLNIKKYIHNVRKNFRQKINLRLENDRYKDGKFKKKMKQHRNKLTTEQVIDRKQKFKIIRNILDKLKVRIERRKKSGKSMMTVNINGQYCFYPFENIDRPTLKGAKYSNDEKTYQQKLNNYDKEIIKYKKKIFAFNVLTYYYKHGNIKGFINYNNFEKWQEKLSEKIYL